MQNTLVVAQGAEEELTIELWGVGEMLQMFYILILVMVIWLYRLLEHLNLHI